MTSPRKIRRRHRRARHQRTLQTLRDQIKADIAWQNLVRGRFRTQVRMSDLRIDEMMARNKASLDKPQYRLAEIFLYAPDRRVAEQRQAALAATLQAQIEKGASFEMVAQQFSAAPSASAGGDLGWMSDADMRPEVAKPRCWPRPSRLRSCRRSKARTAST